MEKSLRTGVLAATIGLVLQTGPPAVAQLQTRWTIDTLSVGRSKLTAASAGTKALFAGGAYWQKTVLPSTTSFSEGISARVDIYDAATGSWTTAALSEPRTGIGAAAAGSKVLFAGGFGTDGYTDPTNRVDIYDATTGAWTVDSLPFRRGGMAAAGAGTKVLFAGGTDTSFNVTNSVAIYDVATGTWTFDSLALPRWNASAVAVGTKILIGGGGFGTSPEQVDIYDVVTGTWSVGALSQNRWHMAAAAAGTKALFAGGRTLEGASISNRVDIYDAATNTWSIDSLSLGRVDLVGAAAGTKIVFGGGLSGTGTSSRADVYDVATGTWSVEFLSKSRQQLAAAAAGSRILFSGGTFFGYKSLDRYQNRVDVYNTEAVGGVAGPPAPIATLSPNPSPVAFNLVLETGGTVRVTDVLGRAVQPDQDVPSGSRALFGFNWPLGVYFITVHSIDGATQTVRAIKY